MRIGETLDLIAGPQPTDALTGPREALVELDIAVRDGEQPDAGWLERQTPGNAKRFDVPAWREYKATSFQRTTCGIDAVS